MDLIWCLVVFFGHFGLILASSDGSDGLFTSSADLERLLDTEAELVRALKDYVKVEEDRIIKIKRYEKFVKLQWNA